MNDVENQPRPTRSRTRAAALVAAGVVAGVVVGGLNVAGAQTSPTPTPRQPGAAPDGGPRRPGPGMKGGPGHHRGGDVLGALRGALHGEFTAPNPDGGYRTFAMQVGEVTAVSATSLTVKSEDGFSRTYAVGDGTLVNAGDDGIADVKNGDKVRVLATLAGDTATAVHVVDTTNVSKLREQWQPKRRDTKPSASPTATT